MDSALLTTASVSFVVKTLQERKRPRPATRGYR